MATDIDSLQIELTANATKANNAIDNLVKKIDRLSISLSKLDGGKLTNLANGVQRLSTAMQGMNNIKTTDFTRLAKNLQSLNNLDVSKLSGVSANIQQITTAVSGFSSLSQGAAQIAEVANGIKQLGYSSAEKAVKNIPELAKAMKKLMSELSTAPKVSQNLIDMTNALAKLARTGSSSGKAATSLSTAFNGIRNSSRSATSGIKKLNISLSSIVKKLLPVISVMQLFNFGKQAVEIASQLTEIQNVVDVTFGNFKQKIEDLASTSITDLGMSELTTKQIASRFQAMGTAMGFTKDKMSDMSVELTRLTGDMASFYDASQADVGKALQSIFTGETEPMRKYGIDLTNATIQQWALNNGMNVTVSKMSQLEKAQLRYQYVLANTGAAQGDFLRTQDSWANQVRILKEQLQQLASVVGGTLVNALKPLVQAFNSAMTYIVAFAETISNALGKIFGWKFEKSGGGAGSDIASELGGGADSANNMADGIGKAAGNAKKLKQNLSLLPFDQLNQMSSADSSSDGGGGGSGSGSGGGGSLGSGSAAGGEWTKTDTIWESFESEISSLFELGKYIGDTLSEAMESIDWDSVYAKARGFGSGLASFLNGLISPRLFGNVGKTIAGSLNTALEFLNSFGTTFDWQNFGSSIASGINNFFKTFNFEKFAETINVWIKGSLKTASTLLDETDFVEIGESIGRFLKELDFSGIAEGLAENLYQVIMSAFGMIGGLIDVAPLETVFLAIFGAFQFKGVRELVSGKLIDAFTEILGIFKEGGIIYELFANASLYLSVAFEGLTGIVLPLEAAFAIIVVAITGFVASIKNAWETSETFRSTVIDAFEKVKESLSGAIKKVKEAIDPLVESVKNLGSKFSELYNNSSIKSTIVLLESLVVSIVGSGLSAAIDAVGTAISGLIGVLSSGIGIISSFCEILTGLFTLDFGKIESGFKDLKKSCSDLLESLKETFVSSGEDLIDGLFEGITSALSTIKSWLKEHVTEPITKNFKNLFGIHSPSTVFKEFGTMLIKGLTEGISSKVSDVKEKFGKVKDTITDTWDNVKEKTESKWSDIKTKLSTTWSNITGKSSTEFTATEKNITNSTQNVSKSMDTMSSDTDVKMSNMLRSMTAQFNSQYSTITQVWENISKKTISQVGDMKRGIEGEIPKIASVFSSLPNKISSSLSGLYSIGRNVANSLKSGLQSIHIPMPHISTSWNNIKLGKLNVSLPSFNLKWYKNSGFPDGEVWGMNEAGNPEMVGKVGNKTAVANNKIIADAIEAAVVRGMVQVLSNKNSGNEKTPQYIMNSIVVDKREIAKVITEAQESRERRFNPSPAF